MSLRIALSETPSHPSHLCFGAIKQKTTAKDVPASWIEFFSLRWQQPVTSTNLRDVPYSRIPPLTSIRPYFAPPFLRKQTKITRNNRRHTHTQASSNPEARTQVDCIFPFAKTSVFRRFKFYALLCSHTHPQRGWVSPQNRKRSSVYLRGLVQTRRPPLSSVWGDWIG